MRIGKKFLATVLGVCIVFGGGFCTKKASAETNGEKMITINEDINDPNEIIQFLKTNFPQNTYTVNELDLLESIKGKSKEELVEEGMQADAADYFVNYDFNAALTPLAEESTKELKEGGFDERQINKIKEYDGRTDAIDYATNYSLSSATVTCSFGPTLINNTQRMSIYYSAVWSSRPLFEYKDTVGLGWIACDSNSNKIETYLETGTCFVQYYMGDNYAYMQEHTVTDKGNYISATYAMKQSDVFNAKIVSGRITVYTAMASNNLYGLKVNMTYGHGIVTIDPSISYTFGSGLKITSAVGFGVENCYDETRVYKYDGSQIW